MIILWVILGRSLSREAHSLLTHNSIRFAKLSAGVTSAIDIETTTSSGNRGVPQRGPNVGDKESTMPDDMLTVLTLRTSDSDRISISTSS